jgi:hypothetical protein
MARIVRPPRIHMERKPKRWWQNSSGTHWRRSYKPHPLKAVHTAWRAPLAGTEASANEDLFAIHYRRARISPFLLTPQTSNA